MVCVVVNVGAAETVAAAGLPLPCRVVGGCQGRGYRGRGRRFRVESQEHVQGQQACQHTQQGCHIQRLAFVVVPVVPPVVQCIVLEIKEVSVNLVVGSGGVVFSYSGVCQMVPLCSVLA